MMNDADERDRSSFIARRAHRSAVPVEYDPPPPRLRKRKKEGVDQP